MLPFISRWWTPFSIYWKTGLVAMNSLSFCLPGKVFISPHFWRTALLDEVLLISHFFSFSALNISFHSLLACEISAEKSTGKIMGVPCKLQALSFLLLLRFSLWFFTYLLYAICLGENFCKLILSDGLWASWTWMFNSHLIWDVLSHYFS